MKDFTLSLPLKVGSVFHLFASYTTNDEISTLSVPRLDSRRWRVARQESVARDTSPVQVTIVLLLGFACAESSRMLWGVPLSHLVLLRMRFSISAIRDLSSPGGIPGTAE